MLPAEKARFFEIVQASLNGYAKFPDERELEAWWNECQGLTLDALQTAFKAHKDDPDRGEKAPRPVDITRRLKTGRRDDRRCSATDTTGRCEYPGIFSEGTQGEGPWYCPLHLRERAGLEASRRIEYSRAVAWESFREKQAAKRLAESVRAAPVVDTARAIAKRHGNRPWQTGLADLLPKAEEAA